MSAIVDCPALSLVASGNLGAICYSRWRGVAVARDVYTGTDPNTADQQIQRANVTSVSQAWGGTLTSSERSAWRQAAREQVFINRLDKKWTPTGYHYFIKMNVQAKTLGYAIQNLPPESKVGVFPIEVDLRNSVTFPDLIGLVMRKSGSEKVESTGIQGFFAGPYNSAGRRPIDGEWRYKGISITVAWVYSDVVIKGKYYWGKVRWFWSSGETGNFWEFQIQAD